MIAHYWKSEFWIHHVHAEQITDQQVTENIG